MRNTFRLFRWATPPINPRKVTMFTWCCIHQRAKSPPRVLYIAHPPHSGCRSLCMLDSSTPRTSGRLGRCWPGNPPAWGQRLQASPSCSHLPAMGDGGEYMVHGRSLCGRWQMRREPRYGRQRSVLHAHSLQHYIKFNIIGVLISYKDLAGKDTFLGGGEWQNALVHISYARVICTQSRHVISMCQWLLL